MSSNYSDFLGKESIKKLLIKLSGPAIIGMIVLSLYNLVDAIFIGRFVGTLAIAGVAITFPFQMIVMALSLTIGIGASSIISRRLGEGQKKEAEIILGNFVSLTIISSLGVTVLGLLFLTPLLKIFGATQDILLPAQEYLGVILIGTLGLMFSASGNNVIRAEGNAKFAMAVMLVSAGMNIILDPIFIVVLNLGIKGAAWATVVSQYSSAALVFFYFFKSQGNLKIRLNYLLLKFKTIKEIFIIGSSTFARQVSASLGAVIVNHAFGLYGGSLAIAAFGIIYRLLMFLLMPMFGIIQGLQPIVGYNYGAKKFNRVKEAVLLATKMTTLLAVSSYVFLMVFPKVFISMFTTDTELIVMSVRALRIVILFMPLIGFQVIAGGMFQSMGKAGPAFVLSLLRQTLLVIPLILILPTFFKLSGVWWTFPIADLAAGIVTYLMFIKALKDLPKERDTFCG